MNIGITIGKVKKSISKTDLTKTISISIFRICILDNLGNLKINFGSLYKGNINYYDENTNYIRSGFNNNVNDIVIQDDGKILCSGNLTIYNGVTLNRIARLNSDGSIDNSFIIGTGFNNYTNTVKIQDDGKILVGGNFTSYNGNTSNRIARLNSDGSIDTSFIVGTGFNSEIRGLAIQDDGKILVVGDFTTYNGVTSNRIARLNSNGSIDTSFIVGTGFNSNLICISIQNDGKILVGGNFATYKGVTSNKIARLNSDGSIDTSFITGTGFNGSIDTIEIQDDGKILAAGNFGNYNGSLINKMVKLTPDGLIDPRFNIGTGFNNVVETIAIQDDGGILVGGQFTIYNGVSSNRIVKLNPDGSIDNSFIIGAGFNSAVEKIIAIPDGSFLCSGQFGGYNNI